jgi:hypothetical protein
MQEGRAPRLISPIDTRFNARQNPCTHAMAIEGVAVGGPSSAAHTKVFFNTFV